MVLHPPSFRYKHAWCSEAKGLTLVGWTTREGERYVVPFPAQDGYTTVTRVLFRCFLTKERGIGRAVPRGASPTRISTCWLKTAGLTRDYIVNVTHSGQTVLVSRKHGGRRSRWRRRRRLTT